MSAFQELLEQVGDRLEQVHALEGGGNSRVFQLRGSSGTDYVAKLYPPAEPDRADRLEVEFTTLRLLQPYLDCLARPLSRLPLQRLALYSRLPGVRPVRGQCGPAAILALVDCLVGIQSLRDESQSSHLPAASEACFSLTQHRLILRRRLEGLWQELPAQGQLPQQVRKLLEQRFVPWLESLAGQDFLVRPEERVLSPSDFGFHNALVDETGRFYFVDFEYFGWDDPAKMIADFHLHPQTAALGADSTDFQNQLLNRLPQPEGFQHRLQQVYTICAAKWVLIFLNVFRERWRQQQAPSEELLEERLQAAKSMLKHLER